MYNHQWVFAYPIKRYTKINSLQTISINWLRAHKTVTKGQKIHIYFGATCQLVLVICHQAFDLHGWKIGLFPSPQTAITVIYH